MGVSFCKEQRDANLHLDEFKNMDYFNSWNKNCIWLQTQKSSFEDIQKEIERESWSLETGMTPTSDGTSSPNQSYISIVQPCLYTSVVQPRLSDFSITTESNDHSSDLRIEWNVTRSKSHRCESDHSFSSFESLPSLPNDESREESKSVIVLGAESPRCILSDWEKEESSQSAHLRRRRISRSMTMPELYRRRSCHSCKRSNVPEKKRALVVLRVSNSSDNSSGTWDSESSPRVIKLRTDVL